MLFFSKNRFFSIIILIVSFFIPAVGAAGILALLFSLMAGKLLGFDTLNIESGIYSYSAILFGLGFASNFEFGNAFMLLLIIVVLLLLLFFNI